MSDRPVGDAVDQEFRRLVSDIASVPGPAPELDELRSPVLTLEKERTMSQGVKYGLVAAVAAAAAIIVGLVLFVGGGDEGGRELDTIEEGPYDERIREAEDALSMDPTADEWPDAFSPDVIFTGTELLGNGVGTLEAYRSQRVGMPVFPDYTLPECSGSVPTADGEVVVTCQETYSLADNLAIGAAQATATLTTIVRIGDDGIKEVSQRTSIPSVGDGVGFANTRWLAAYHPSESVFNFWYPTDTLEEKVRQIERYLELNAEWGAYNDRYGCDLDNWETCGPAAVANAAVRSWLAGDVGTIRDLLTPDAGISGAVDSIDELDQRIAYEQAIGLRSTLPICRSDAPADEAGATSITCEGAVSTSASRALGVPSMTVDLLRLDVSDESRIVALDRGVETPEYLNRVWNVLVDWLGANHPTDVANMIDSDGQPITTPEAIELWAAHTEEFVSAQG